MRRQNDRKRAVIRFAKAIKNANEGPTAIRRYQESGTLHLRCDTLDLQCDVLAGGVEEAITEIARYQEALREVRESGDEDLECDVLADGVDVVVDGRQWSIALYPDAWSVYYDGEHRDEPDIDGRLGPADLSPTELVSRLRTGQLHRIDTSWSPRRAARVPDWPGGSVGGRSVSDRWSRCWPPCADENASYRS